MNLICIPFAGGNCYSYRPLADGFEGVSVSTMELPGRGKRIAEPLVHSLDEMCEDLFRQAGDRLDAPYAFYGHSLGALLAWKLTKAVSQAGLRLPECLFLSGCPGPRVERSEQRHLLPWAEFVAMLERLGGCDPQVLQDRELLEFMEPVVRADFCAVDTFRYRQSEPLSVPMCVMIGDGDTVSESDAAEWQHESTHPLLLKRFPGNHFFILDHWPKIRQLILECVKRPWLNPGSKV